MIITIDQSDEDPKLFIPKCEKAKMIAKLLDRQTFTIEDINEIRSIKIEFLIAYEEIPIGGRFKMYDEYAIWYDNNSRRYFGRKLDKKGYLNTHHIATARTPEEIRTKLFHTDPED